MLHRHLAVGIDQQCPHEARHLAAVEAFGRGVVDEFYVARTGQQAVEVVGIDRHLAVGRGKAVSLQSCRVCIG